MVLLAPWLTPAGAHAAHAGECPASNPFAIPAGGLPAAATAARAGRLAIAAFGGGATLGNAARDRNSTYPARLGVYLRAALPGVEISVATVAIPRQPSTVSRLKLEAVLSERAPALVVWGAGGGEAGRGDDLDSFNAYIADTVAKIREAGADPVLMTVQYAPSVARVVNLLPYRMAVLRAAEAAGIPVFDRYEAMRYWSETGYLDLDTTDDAERVRVAREVYDCMAKFLAKGIADAIK